jgi:hypothetical protein
MRSRIASSVILAAAACLLVPAALTSTAGGPSASRRDPQKLVVHEWGTFTSIAAEDGSAVQWVPQQGPADLPCFVRHAQSGIKGWLLGTVRMETPVLYFYAPRETTVDVKVRFKHGAITEWYPDAGVTPATVQTSTLSDPSMEGSITWRDVRVMPGATESFPGDGSENHYYVARRTDAVPVRVGTQDEKFLFYRGVGNFAPPLRGTVADNGHVVVTAEAGQAIGDVMLFENRSGRSAFRTERLDGSRADLPPIRRGPASASSSPRDTLVRLLVQHGLFRKEAVAMVDTWRDSWFEDGTRLFYVMPTRIVDARLPLEISPPPDAVSRVFVGRLELISKDRLAELKRAIDARDRAGVARHGRFLRPMLERLGLHNAQPGTPDSAAAAFAYGAVMPDVRACR